MNLITDTKTGFTYRELIDTDVINYKSDEYRPYGSTFWTLMRDGCPYTNASMDGRPVGDYNSGCGFTFRRKIEGSDSTKWLILGEDSILGSDFGDEVTEDYGKTWRSFVVVSTSISPLTPASMRMDCHNQSLIYRRPTRVASTQTVPLYDKINSLIGDIKGLDTTVTYRTLGLDEMIDSSEGDELSWGTSWMKTSCYGTTNWCTPRLMGHSFRRPIRGSGNLNAANVQACIHELSTLKESLTQPAAPAQEVIAIRVGNETYTAEFKDKVVKFGCASIDNRIFIHLNATIQEQLKWQGHTEGVGNRGITLIKIGKGEFTPDLLNKIATRIERGNIKE